VAANSPWYVSIQRGNASLSLTCAGPAAEPGYGVLRLALAQRQRWALGRIVLGGHRQVVLVRPTDTTAPWLVPPRPRRSYHTVQDGLRRTLTMCCRYLSITCWTVRTIAMTLHFLWQGSDRAGSNWAMLTGPFRLAAGNTRAARGRQPDRATEATRFPPHTDGDGPR
jgi:hypothetical protein